MKVALLSLILMLSGSLMADTTGLPPAPGVPQPAPEPVPAPAPAPLAEIQIFYGYRGYDNYDSKLVSTQYRPLSVDYIASGFQAAACYKGDPVAALDLFGQMVNIYNYQARRNIQFVDGNFYFYADGKGALQIDTRDEVNLPFLVFPRMIECDRWSTPEERGEY